MQGLLEEENVADRNNTRESNTGECNTGECNTDVTISASFPLGPDADVSRPERGRADHKFYVPQCGLVFYVMVFLAYACTFGLRAGLSVAIVAMVNQTAFSDDEVMINTSDTDQCTRDLALKDGSGEFVWDRNQQGTVLAAFFYGRLLTQVQR